MRYIKRRMTVDESEKVLFGDSPRCQAALNSDGCITIRNYREGDQNEDSLIVLSRRETEAVIRLFSEIGTMQRNNTLPF